MATSHTERYRTSTERGYRVTATADADETHTIPHGLGRIPDHVTLTPIDISGGEAARVSNWVFTGIDATDIDLEKTTDVGSGDQDPQLDVDVRLRRNLSR